MRSPLLSLVSLIVFVVRANANILSWPAVINIDSTATISWTGIPNFNFIVMGNSSEGQTAYLFQDLNTSALSVQWTANVPVGETVFFLLADTTGTIIRSDNVVISNSSVVQSSIPRVTATSGTQPSSSFIPFSATLGVAETTKPSVTTSTAALSPSFTSLASSTSVTSSSQSIPSPIPTPIPNGNNDPEPPNLKDNSIPFVIGIVAAIAFTTIMVFLWRYLRARRRRLQASKSNFWNLGPEKKNFNQTDPSSYSGSTPIARVLDIYVAPPERDWPYDGNVPKDGAVPKNGPDAPVSGVEAGAATSLQRSESKKTFVTISEGSTYTSSRALDNARASSIMLPPAAYSPPSNSRFGAEGLLPVQSLRSRPPVPTIPTVLPKEEWATSAAPSSWKGKGHPHPSSSIAPPRHDRKLSVPSSPNSFDDGSNPFDDGDNPFDDGDLEIQFAPSLDAHSGIPSIKSPSRSFPHDANSEEFTLQPISFSHTSQHSSGILSPSMPQLHSQNVSLKRTATRAKRDYPNSPTTPFYPSSPPTQPPFASQTGYIAVDFGGRARFPSESAPADPLPHGNNWV